METLNIRPTPQSFEISCTEGLIEVRGCSIINDPKVFFKPFQSWLKFYLTDPPEVTVVNIRIDYIDSASIRIFMGNLKLLEKLIPAGRSVVLNWYYEQDDKEILKLGEILSTKVDLPFNLVPL